MVLEFLGAAHEVTGSCHYLSFGDKHILVDCVWNRGRICTQIRRFRSMQR